MYPLIQIGPLALSSGGLLLLLAIMVSLSLIPRVAVKRGDATHAAAAERWFYAALVGAVVGGRLAYGLLHWDLYSRSPALFVALRVEAFSWPGALLGGLVAAALWSRWRGRAFLPLADTVALVMPVAQAIASVGFLLSGEVLGNPTALPFGIVLLGAPRHPTQLYLLLTALVSLPVLWLLARRATRPGSLLMAWLGMHGLGLLLIEALRADSPLLPGGLRATQLAGFVLLLAALFWGRHHSHPTGASA